MLLNHLCISHRHLDEKADIAACEAFSWAMTHDSECIFTADFTANGSDATDVCASRSPRIPRRVSSVFYLLNIYRFTFNVAHVSRVFISDFLDFVFSLERSSFRPPPPKPNPSRSFDGSEVEACQSVHYSSPCRL